MLEVHVSDIERKQVCSLSGRVARNGGTMNFMRAGAFGGYPAVRFYGNLIFMDSEEEIGYAAAKYSFHFYG